LHGDDFAFVFTSKSGWSGNLQLGTGETGMLMVAAPSGGAQSLRVHCLDAVQPAATDDYWNYDFWAVVNAPVDASAGGGG
jgi:hypothetical protein